MRKIIDNNEIAFYEKYRFSLQDKWSSLKEDEQIIAINNAEKADEYAVSLAYDKEIILRVLIGFGGQKCLQDILHNSAPTLRALVWEPYEDIFLAYCTVVDLSEYIKDRRLDIVIGDNIENLETSLRRNIHDNNAYHSKTKTIGPYMAENNPKVNTFKCLFSKIASEVTQDGFARKKFHKLPCKNALYTLHTINDNYVVSQLFEMIPDRDIPVIIVSAGPSLMKNYKKLSKAKGKSIIIAVTHAMKTLHGENIIPDLVAVTDAGKTGYLDFDSEKNYTLLSSIFAEKECRTGYNGHIIYHGFNLLGNIFYTSRTGKEQDTELDTGSVTTDVFSLFLSAGFKKIILVGQDLAYDEHGNTHTQNEYQEKEKGEYKERFEVDGINGGKVLTRPDWEMFRRFFETKIEETPDIQVIDATEGGALIRGTHIMSLSDAIDIYCKKNYPVDEWIERLEAGDDDEREQIREWFDTNKYDLDTIIKYLEEIIRLNPSIRKKWNDHDISDNEFSAMCRRYDVLFDQIIEGTRGDLLRLFCIEEIQKYIENALLLEGDENAIQRMEMEYKLLLSLTKGADELRSYINDLMDHNL